MQNSSTHKIKTSPYEEDSRARSAFEATHLQRVLVIPIRVFRNNTHHSKRGIFILIFGYGEVVVKGHDVIVIWDETHERFDYLPFKRQVIK